MNAQQVIAKLNEARLTATILTANEILEGLGIDMSFEKSPAGNIEIWISGKYMGMMAATPEAIDKELSAVIQLTPWIEE